MDRQRLQHTHRSDFAHRLDTCALYFVHDSDARLGIVLGFIVLFALGLSLTTSANGDAVFAATAAYAAVLIVYISGDAVNDASKATAVAACNATMVR